MVDSGNSIKNSSKANLTINFFVIIILFTSQVSFAQTQSSVTLNLEVLEVFDPAIGVPKLLMPSSNSSSGRILLRPPPGVTPINRGMNRVVLTPPPGLPSQVTKAPKIDIPPVASPASSPPVKVTAAPKETNKTENVSDNKTSELIPSADNDKEKINLQSDKNDSTLINITNNEPKEVASIPSSINESLSSQSDRNTFSLPFKSGETKLPENASTILDPIAEELNKNTGIKIRLLAYASSNENSTSSVRRTSLSRALSVRQFLINKGIQNTRIEVRALGNKDSEENSDRVDVVFNRP